MEFTDNKDLFMEEARELLGKIQDALLSLEKTPQDQELVNECFRHLHTLKGSGTMFGFSDISDFTHQVENLFDEVRKGRIPVSHQVIELGLRSADIITALLGDQIPSGMQDVLDQIRLCAGSPQVPAQAAAENHQAIPLKPASPDPPHPGGCPDDDTLPRVWRISFKPRSTVLHRGVRIESLIRELELKGICHIQAETAALPFLEDLDPTLLHISWTITLSTVAREAEIREIFMFVEEYADLSIQEIPLENQCGEPTIPRIGEVLVSRGIIAPEDTAEILKSQHPFGEAAVASGKVSPEQIKAALAEQALVRSTQVERETRQDSSFIRVRTEKVDGLVDQVGELVILQAILEQEAKKHGIPAFGALAENLARLSINLRDSTMSIRMVPLEESFSRFKRLVRDLAQNLGKELNLEITGGSTELDKNVIEALKDPLIHIIRNSADHGIETPVLREAQGKPRAGTIHLEARQTGSRVEISISDDGAGLNLQKIRQRGLELGLLEPGDSDENRIMNLIFEPGFSTAERTTGISGRGVGMDVVKRNIERLRGEIHIRSTPGKGASITLSIPLTLVIVEGLLVRINGFDYVISLANVEECVDLTPDIQAGSDQSRMINLRGKTIPVVSIRESLGISPAYDGMPRLVVAVCEGQTVALMVDMVLGRKQIVIKPLSSTLRRIKAVSGATILGDGSVALILDINEIVKRSCGTGAPAIGS